MNLKTNAAMRPIVALLIAGGLLLTSGCLPEQEPGNVTSTPTQTPLAPDAPFDAPVNEVRPQAEVAPAPPPPPPGFEVPEGGGTVLLLEIETVERSTGLVLPTIRRVSLDVHGLDDDGRPALVNDEPILVFSEIVSTPSFPIITVGPNVPMVNIKVAMYGNRDDAVLVTVAVLGQPSGLRAFGAIEPPKGLTKGIVIMNIPVVVR